MKKRLFSLLLLLSLPAALQAQDAVYTANGRQILNARLTDVTDQRIFYDITKGGKTKTNNYARQNILFAFSNSGHFLLISGLSADLAQAKGQLRIFLTAPPRPGDKDYLIKAVPFSVVPVTISYESDAIVNYITADGKPASISKGELVAIIYHTGKHSLLMEPADVAPLLPDISAYFESSFSAVSPPTTVSTSTVTKADQPEATAQSLQPVVAKSISDTVQQEKQAEKLLPENSLSLSEAQYQYYRKKSIQKVEEFAQYLNTITNKSLSLEARNQAITQAAELFMPAATIEVTSSKRPGSNRFAIKAYLKQLKLLPYTSTKIEWSEVQFLKELSKAADGNYYGTITGQQKFFGSGSNATYTDFVRKNVRVKLEQLPGVMNGIETTSWNLLLGSIGVSAQ